jgi:hypothetical protein
MNVPPDPRPGLTELRVYDDDASSGITIAGNADGLRTFAQDDVPPGTHAHLDPGVELDDDSLPLIVDKTP